MPHIQPDFIRGSSGGGGTGFFCFLSGTRIGTPDEKVCIEDLAVGSMVLTEAGEARPVRWVGHRNLDCSRYRDPARVWPIRIQADAFAPQQPVRDLFVSPGHSVCVAGVLVQACNLLNGATITQVPRDHVDYWHVELDSHDIVLAEGLPTESYLDTGSRTAFIGGGAFLEAYPDFKPKDWRETCRPLVMEGPVLQTIRKNLLARAEALGHVLTDDPDLHAFSQGQRIEPMRLAARRLAFVLPGSGPVELRCRSFIPAAVEPGSNDTRALGINVERLQIDGLDWDLADQGAFADGWHELERRPDDRLHRWSKERVVLPENTRLVVIDLVDSAARYWVTPSPVPEDSRAISGAANS
jgi:hypothetical protein